jgi:DNA invertase Pin-like site-specific DNA recombinase
MSANRGLKIPIIELRKQGKSYRQIESELKCGRSTIHYHCNNHNLNDTGKKRYPVSDDLKLAISKFCKENSTSKAQKHFGLSKSTVFNYKNFQLKKNVQK